MSGSGGGGGGPSGPPPARDCASIFEQTILNSPDEAVLEELRVDDVLNLVVADRALIAMAADAAAGSITSRNAVRIIRCIEEEGFEFVAIVRHVDPGVCRVDVQPAG